MPDFAGSSQRLLATCRPQWPRCDGASSAFNFSPGNPVRTIIRFKQGREDWEYTVESNRLRWKKFEKKIKYISIECRVLRYVKRPCRSNNGKAKFVQP